MALKFFNTLGRKLETFKPLHPGEVSLYTCGPTVYDAVHLGNWRTFIFEDVLKRVFLYPGYQVKHVMNITDIEDKIITRASEQGISIEKLTSKYTEQFFTDRDKLNILPADSYPKATDNVTAMIILISKLFDKGLAYESAGSIYYAVEKFKDYGKLSGVSLNNLKSGARGDNDEYPKDAPADFALWKAAKDGEPAWDSPWGKGRPGWHIECSAMSMKELGETLDIHAGGVDLIFPHHENEIAQSEGATGKPFANYWLEGEHLKIDDEKMSKSLKNIFTLETLKEKGYSPLAYRYLTLTAHYRKQLNFTWESLTAAQTALNKLENFVRDITEIGEIDKNYQTKFKTSLEDDLNVPQVLAVVWELINNKNITDTDKKATLLDFDQVLGLGLADLKQIEIPEEVKKLIEKREADRTAGDFAKSDELREQILALGFKLEDSPSGPKIRAN